MPHCITFILFWNDTVHVSDRLSVHHQEIKTVHTATGICQTDTADCLLAFQNKINLIHWCIWLVLLYKSYYDARPYERQICVAAFCLLRHDWNRAGLRQNKIASIVLRDIRRLYLGVLCLRNAMWFSVNVILFEPTRKCALPCADLREIHNWTAASTAHLIYGIWSKSDSKFGK